MAMIEYRVSNTGSNSNNGRSASSPLLTAQQAVNLAKAGDKILLDSKSRFYESLIPNKSGLVWDVYNGSDRATISGFKTLSNWISIGNGLWECTDPSLPGTLEVLLVDGQQIEKATFPKINNGNNGYLNISSAGANTVTNSVLNGLPSLVGATVHIRTSNYTIERNFQITAHNGSTINFSGGSVYSVRNNWGFFITNHRVCLTKQGDWMYTGASRKVTAYFGSTNPNTLNVQASQKTNLIFSTWSSIISEHQFNNILFEGSNGDLIRCEGGNGLEFHGCRFQFAGEDAAKINNHTESRFDHCEVEYINNSGLFLRNETAYAKVHNTTVKNVGMLKAHLKSGMDAGTGIQVPWDYSEAIGNRIENVGYIGINFQKKYTKANYNKVRKFGMLLNDGGGIYTWNASTNPDLQPGMECKWNLVWESGDAHHGTQYTWEFLNRGTYLDDQASGLTVEYNSVWAILGSGYFLHNAEQSAFRRNLAYDCQVGLATQSDVSTSSADRMRELILQGNRFIAKTAGQIPMAIHSNGNDVGQFAARPADWNNNVVARPITNDGNIVRHQAGGGTSEISMASWRSLYGYDADSTNSPLAIDSVDKFLLEYNESDVAAVVQLAGTYIDMWGVQQPRSLTLPPSGSALLIKISDDIPEDPDEPTDPDPEEPTDQEEPGEPTDPEVNISLSVRIPGRVYRTLLAAVKTYKPPA